MPRGSCNESERVTFTASGNPCFSFDVRGRGGGGGRDVLGFLNRFLLTFTELTVKTSRRIIVHPGRNLTTFSHGLVVGKLELIEGTSLDSEAMPDARTDANQWFLQDDFSFLLQ